MFQQIILVSLQHYYCVQASTSLTCCHIWFDHKPLDDLAWLQGQNLSLQWWCITRRDNSQVSLLPGASLHIHSHIAPLHSDSWNVDRGISKPNMAFPKSSIPHCEVLDGRDCLRGKGGERLPASYTTRLNPTWLQTITSSYGELLEVNSVGQQHTFLWIRQIHSLQIGFLLQKESNWASRRYERVKLLRSCLHTFP